MGVVDGALECRWVDRQNVRGPSPILSAEVFVDVAFKLLLFSFEDCCELGRSLEKLAAGNSTAGLHNTGNCGEWRLVLHAVGDF